MLNSKRVSEQLGVSERHVRNMTKKALKGGKSSIVCKGEKFTFKLVSTPETYGKAYFYTPIKASKASPKPRRRAPSSVAINPAELPEIADFKRPTAEEKLAVITFCNTSKLPYGHIAKGLICKHEAFEVKASSLETKIRRWDKSYRKDGISALEDKRGGTEAKVDVERLKRVLYACGTKHCTSQFEHYCYLYAKDNDLMMDLRNPVADIHYTTFVRAVERLKRDDPHISEFLAIGMDAFTYAEPSVGRDWEYANQQWEIDATKKDIMVKVPVVGKESKNTGYRDYFTREATEDFHLVRMQIIGIIDNCTGSTVYGLYNSSNYYGNARLLHKSIKKLGKPEQMKGDNGKDFVSQDFQQLLVDLGIPYIAAEKGRGDQKGKIERSFRTVQHCPAFESLAGFVGHSVDQRQHLENESSTKLEKLSGVATNIKGDLMWWWEFENWLDNYLDHTQADRYEQHTPATTSELDYIYSLLGKRHFRTVSRNGIRHNHQYYFSVELWDQVTIGDKVQIIENIDDSNRLFVFKQTRLLCEVVKKGEFRKGTTLEEVTQVKKAYKQRVVKEDKSLAKQAQKEYGSFQNAMRDEFLNIETRNADIKREQEKQKADNGFDSLAEFRRYALRAVQ